MFNFSNSDTKSARSKRVFKEAEAANYICMSRSFLSQDRMNGVLVNRTPGPKFIRIGRSVRYLKDDLDAWLDQHRDKTKP